MARAGRKGKGQSALRRRRPPGERDSIRYEVCSPPGWPESTCPAALAIAKEFPASGRNSATGVLWNIALRLAADNPAEAERVMRQVPQAAGTTLAPSGDRLEDGRNRSSASPEAGRRGAAVLRPPADVSFPGARAEGTRPRRRRTRRFKKPLQGIDRLMKEGAEYSAMRGDRGVLLPLVEQIDPALVPELFWRAIATRPPIGNPGSLRDFSVGGLVVLLGWYDREVAAALFEPARALMEQTDDRDLAGFQLEFLGWSIFDPRAAVARLEQVAVAPELGNSARERVAESLALSYEDRWRLVWSVYTEMRDLLERDFR